MSRRRRAVADRCGGVRALTVRRGGLGADSELREEGRFSLVACRAVRRARGVPGDFRFSG